MKIKLQIKKVLTLLFMTVPMLAIAQNVIINEENFPDENFRAYLLKQWYGEDGVITQDEIEDEVTHIDVRGKNIRSLQGITYFRKLYYLECSKNLLTSLDLSGCKELYTLNCYDNQLSSLNVSGCIELEFLHCYNNNLTSLNVSDCVGLDFLYCDNNQLTSLNVSGCTDLYSLRCYNNQLTSLDVSECTNLRYLYCYNNKLSSLDISKNQLYDLRCQNNQLTALNVSQHTALTDLYCNNNLLSSLDVSQNTALQSLYCSNNQIYGNEMDAFVESLPEKISDEEGVYRLYIYNDIDDTERNICTESHVAAIKIKGWTPYYYGTYMTTWGDTSEDWLEYEGIDEDANAISQPTIEGIDKNAPIYNLAGQRIENLQGKKGVYIVGGKKVLMK